ncbi:MAG: phospholipid carrier-dependent glycosyltransferase [Cyanobacteria bacterium P01_D01_bin.36]
MVFSSGSAGRVGRWLWVLFAIALFIRFTHLAAKPAWLDEVATATFSLGNYSRLIEQNQVISLAQVTRPIQLTPGATVSDVVTHLMTEDNHPPIYFVLGHWWVMAFHHFFSRFVGPVETGTYVSVWALRSLSAFFGALAVPVTYWLGWVSFRDRTTALLCAALMAVSPFSVYLSQEARHYTLAILTVMLSLGCFVIAVRSVLQQIPMRWRMVFLWIGVNALGMAVHYFCGLTYVAEGIVLLWLLIRQSYRKDACGEKTVWQRPSWRRVYVAAVGTAIGILAWVPILLHFYGSPQTSYIAAESRGIGFWVVPIIQSVIGWMYAIMSPITNGFTWQMVVVIVVTSVFVVLMYGPWVGFYLVRSLQVQLKAKAETKPLLTNLQPGLLALSGFFIVSNLVFLLITYVAGFDITRGHRYSFAFYPSIIVLAGAGLAPFLRQQKIIPVKIPPFNQEIKSRTFVFMVLLMGFLGTQTIVFDASNLKYYRPTRFVNFMQTESQYPAILVEQATVSSQPTVLGTEIVSVAWEIHRQLEAAVAERKNSSETKQRNEWRSAPRFLLLTQNVADQNITAQNELTVQLKSTLQTVKRPFDLWVLKENPDLTELGCAAPREGSNGSYVHSHYVC